MARSPIKAKPWECGSESFSISLVTSASSVGSDDGGDCANNTCTPTAANARIAMHGVGLKVFKVFSAPHEPEASQVNRAEGYLRFDQLTLQRCGAATAA